MTFKNEKVLEFYEQLPFNIYGDLKSAEEQIKKFDPIKIYPELGKIFSEYEKIKIIDFGCGGGWLVNSISYHHGDKAEVTGVINPVVIKYANELKDKLKLNAKFISSDLFTFKSEIKYDLIISLGVLHHTNNFMKQLKVFVEKVKKLIYIFGPISQVW